MKELIDLLEPAILRSWPLDKPSGYPHNIQLTPYYGIWMAKAEMTGRIFYGETPNLAVAKLLGC